MPFGQEFEYEEYYDDDDSEEVETLATFSDSDGDSTRHYPVEFRPSSSPSPLLSGIRGGHYDTNGVQIIYGFTTTTTPRPIVPRTLSDIAIYLVPAPDLVTTTPVPPPPPRTTPIKLQSHLPLQQVSVNLLIPIL